MFMKYLPAILFSVFLGFIPAMSSAGSWNGWIYQNPYPTSNTLLAVKFVTPKKGWMAGQHGTILYTEDGGETWEAQESGTEQDIKSIAFVNEKTGWAAGNGGVIVHTEDGGKTWRSQGNTRANLHNVYFLNEKEGWVAGDQGLALFTKDGGKKWTKQDIGTKRNIASVYFINSDIGWLLAGDRVYRTRDGGKKWEKSKLDVDVSGFGSMGRFSPARSDEVPADWWRGELYFADDKNGWAVVGLWFIFHTEDGGKTWTNQLPPGLSYGLNHISFIDAKRGCAAGSSILCTEDGGKTWNERLGIKSRENEFRDGFTISVWGLDFAGQSEGWAVGNDGQILKTENSGKNWKIKNRNPMTETIYFFNAKTGWALKGRYDDLERKSIVGIARTDDGGDTWKVQKEFETPISLRFFFINPTTGWAVGWQWEHNPSFGYTILNALILHTSDGGKTWETQFEKQGSDLALLDAHFIDANVGWIVGSNGLILHTRNGGKHWEQQKSGTKFHLRGVQFIDEKSGWIVGNNGGVLGLDTKFEREEAIVLYTKNSGKQWNATVKKKDVFFFNLFFADKDSGWVTAETAENERGLILNTKDGGKIWTERNVGGDRPVNPFFVNKNIGWMDLYDPNFFLFTTDSGKTWKKQKMPLHKYPWKPFDASIKTNEK